MKGTKLPFKGKGEGRYLAVNGALRGVTSHMGSHSVTCHPTPRLNPSQTGCMVLDLPTLEGCKAELT